MQKGRAYGLGLLLRGRWKRFLDRASTSSHEVHDERDHGEKQEQVDKETADVHQCESAEPKHNQNNCKDKKHRNTSAFLLHGYRATGRARITCSERCRGHSALLRGEIIMRDNATLEDRIYAIGSGFMRRCARRTNAHLTRYSAGVDVWFFPHVAAQPQLGLLSKRRAGIDSCDRADCDAAGSWTLNGVDVAGYGC